MGINFCAALAHLFLQIQISCLKNSYCCRYYKTFCFKKIAPWCRPRGSTFARRPCVTKDHYRDRWVCLVNRFSRQTADWWKWNGREGMVARIRSGWTNSRPMWQRPSRSSRLRAWGRWSRAFRRARWLREMRFMSLASSPTFGGGDSCCCHDERPKSPRAPSSLVIRPVFLGQEELDSWPSRECPKWPVFEEVLPTNPTKYLASTMMLGGGHSLAASRCPLSGSFEDSGLIQPSISTPIRLRGKALAPHSRSGGNNVWQQDSAPISRDTVMMWQASSWLLAAEDLGAVIPRLVSIGLWGLRHCGGKGMCYPT